MPVRLYSLLSILDLLLVAPASRSGLRRFCLAFVRASLLFILTKEGRGPGPSSLRLRSATSSLAPSLNPSTECSVNVGSECPTNRELATDASPDGVPPKAFLPVLKARLCAANSQCLV